MNPQTSQETSLSRQNPLQPSSSRSQNQVPQAQSSKNPTGTNVSDSFKKVGKWTPEEDELLKEYVSLYSEKQWKKVSEHIPGRAPIQCLHRWTKILKPGLVKGPWTQEEDQKLIAWVKKQGPGKWAQAANMIPGRSGKQCRERWFNNLNPDVRKGNWTTAEDELIFQLYQKYGSSWSKIAKYVPGRTENSIKNRFYSTLRKFAASKHRANTRPLDSEFPALEAALQNMKTDAGEVSKKPEIPSSDSDKNMLYKLLQEVGTKPATPAVKGEDQEDTDTVNVNVKKEEEIQTGGDAVSKNKEKKQASKKSENNKALAESNKMLKPTIPLLEKNIHIPSEHRIRDITNTNNFNQNQSKIEEEDPNFERYLLSINHNVQDDLIIRDVDHITETRGGFDELDNLQQKIFDFCSQNIQNLMSAFKTVELTKSPPYNQTPTGHSSPGRGTPTSVDNPMGFKRSHKPSQAGIGTTRPFRPVAIKIPPLEIKETGETSIPKILSMVDKSNVLSNIPPFPNKPGQDADLLSRVLSERRGSTNQEINPKREDDEEKVVNQNLNSLIESMNQTIGAASLVYSHYLTNINETVKKMDETNGEESREKVATMFQQLSSIESWLKNAKAELARLESIVQREDAASGKTKNEIDVGSNGNKRRGNEENIKKMPGEQPMKKKKIN